ncbi:MAG: hypothetical protein ABR881_18685 [Candidatus Sulfotelmatobacter sp.]|jgi:hypothetical protein
MNESERPSTPATPESVWKSTNGKEEASMDITFTPDQLCAMARSREHESIWSRRILLTLLIGLAGAFAYNAFSVSQPWVKLSQAWMLGWTGLLVWKFRRGSRRMSVTESCASFLRRQFETKRSGFLEIRRYLFLLIPPILAAWWGGGPTIRLRALGVDPSSRLYEFASGPWPFLITGLLLVLIWLAFGLAAQKATRELDELRRRTQE